jgi:uncharacterized protein (TIGR03086 family)
MNVIANAMIEADPTVPMIRITRDFTATPAQLFRAHTDPALFRRWVGPRAMDTEIERWDAISGGSWRYIARRDGLEFGFRGCFHEVHPDRIVQTFSFDGAPGDVALETLRFEDLGGGRTRLHAQSLVDSFESRDAWLRGGMQSGIDEGYAKLDELLSADDVEGRDSPLVTGSADSAGAAGSPPTAVSAAAGPAERHRLIAGTFTDRVVGTRDWDAPAPVAGWLARDVVRHLCDWFPAFLQAGTGIELDRGPSPDTDPAAAWQAHADAVQRLLDDPATDGRLLRNPHIGELPLAAAIDQFYTTDVFMHTWDLARATGQDERLDQRTCADLLAGMESMEDVIRTSGQYGPRVAVPPGSDAQTRLLGFIGRDPRA